MPDGNTPVKPLHVRKVLKLAISNLGLNPEYYDTHSLRAGRASDMHKYGFSISQIKATGRWRSGAVFRYLSQC